MKTIQIGSRIGKKGIISEIHFIDLFNQRYLIAEELYTLDEVQEMLTPNKEELFKRIIYLLETNSKVAFKFLEQKTIATKSLPVINQLNPIIQSIWKEIEEQHYFDHQIRESILVLLKKFWYILSN